MKNLHLTWKKSKDPYLRCPVCGHVAGNLLVRAGGLNSVHFTCQNCNSELYTPLIYTAVTASAMVLCAVLVAMELKKAGIEYAVWAAVSMFVAMTVLFSLGFIISYHVPLQRKGESTERSKKNEFFNLRPHAVKLFRLSCPACKKGRIRLRHRLFTWRPGSTGFRCPDCGTIFYVPLWCNILQAATYSLSMAVTSYYIDRLTDWSAIFSGHVMFMISTVVTILISMILALVVPMKQWRGADPEAEYRANPPGSECRDI